MANNGWWFKLYVGWHESPWLQELEYPVPWLFPALLEWVRISGRNGRCKAPSVHKMAAFFGVPVQHFETLIGAAIADGCLQVEDGEWIVANWKAYQQSDSAERMRRLRTENASKNSPAQSPKSDAQNGKCDAQTGKCDAQSAQSRHASHARSEKEKEKEKEGLSTSERLALAREGACSADCPDGSHSRPSDPDSDARLAEAQARLRAEKGVPDEAGPVRRVK